jgi:hypothetical protein
MQVQRMLGGLHELGNLGIGSNRQAAFGEHDLGGRLHELLGRTNRAGRIVWQGAPDALQLGADPRRVSETGQGCLKCGWAPPTDPATLIELEAVVVQQLTDLVETTGPMPLLAGQPTKLRPEHPQRPLHLRHVSPVHASGIGLERHAPHAGVLVVEVAHRHEPLVLP